MTAEPMAQTDRPGLQPLAYRLRPRSLDRVVGQQHLLAPGRPLREAIESGAPGSLIFWGPPGCGKTTLAWLIAEHTDATFVLFSAVTEGVPRVREIIAAARARADERPTILFCDEIHRFNKAQQDAFLPSVESGVITLIGATTENPSFALNSALLSRMRVFTLQPLGIEDVVELLRRGWAGIAADQPAGDSPRADVPEETLTLLARHCGGDGRIALNTLEALWQRFRTNGFDAAVLLPERVVEVLERPVPIYDRAGDRHFDLISALHKSVRGSDVEASLYWFARMIEGGEDPMYIARRMVRIASEDIGLADPRALTLTLAARDAYSSLGSPEGELALVEALIFLATAPKSNRCYAAWNSALQAARDYPHEPVPNHIRNAPTRLMRELGHGSGYRYDHDEGGHAAGQDYLPDALKTAQWYEPTEFGLERQIAERVRWWKEQRRVARQ
ncbi:MAG TPA: replication-associated recombination protein A [Gammaproteobacteria bacterium]|nr:replication-associated recombination protein A [Gammaproteobacteria bacterium]